MQWLNDSLIHGLWNYVFLFSNISLFVLLPFAYFFTESEGFFGSSRGIMSRVNETIVLILLLMVIILGITYLLYCTFGYSELALTNLLTIWHYLPLLYSCISFFGVVLLLVCTPIGFAILFTVLGDLIVKPQFLRDIQQEYEVALLEEMHLRTKLERKRSDLKLIEEKACYCPTHCNESSITAQKLDKKISSFNLFDVYKTKSLPSFTSFLTELSPSSYLNNVNNSSSNNKSNNISEIKDQLLNETINNCSIAHLNCIRRRKLFSQQTDDQLIEKELNELTDENKNDSKIEDYVKQLAAAEVNRKKLQTLKRASALRRNFGYPLAILLLLCLTLLSIGMVLKNILELLVGIKALPISSAAHRFTLGITSLYKLGYFGAVLEILLIFYLWHTSLVGLYSLPFLQRIKPQIHNTSFTVVIINCALLLILSSALPVLARTIGITNFDLLGDFGKIEWLGSWFVVLFYNLAFVSFSTFTLARKFTILMHKELFIRLSNLWITNHSTTTPPNPSALVNRNISILQSNNSSTITKPPNGNSPNNSMHSD